MDDIDIASHTCVDIGIVPIGSKELWWQPGRRVHMNGKV
jgi:hypothetical protein